MTAPTSDWPSSATPIETTEPTLLPSIHVDSTILRRIRTLLYSSTVSGEHLANLSARELSMSSPSPTSPTSTPILTIDALYPISHPPPTISIPLLSHLPPTPPPTTTRTQNIIPSTQSVPHLLQIFRTIAVCSSHAPLTFIATIPDIRFHLSTARNVRVMAFPPRGTQYGLLRARGSRLIATAAEINGRSAGRGVGMWTRDEMAIRRLVWIRAWMYVKNGVRPHRMLVASLGNGMEVKVRTAILGVEQNTVRLSAKVRQIEDRLVAEWIVEDRGDRRKWNGEQVLGDVREWLEEVDERRDERRDKRREKNEIRRKERSVEESSLELNENDESSSLPSEEEEDEKFMELMCKKYLFCGYSDEVEKRMGQIDQVDPSRMT